MLEALFELINNIGEGIFSFTRHTIDSLSYASEFISYVSSLDFSPILGWLPPALFGVVSAAIGMFILVRILEVI